MVTLSNFQNSIEPRTFHPLTPWLVLFREGEGEIELDTGVETSCIISIAFYQNKKLKKTQSCGICRKSVDPEDLLVQLLASGLGERQLRIKNPSGQRLNWFHISRTPATQKQAVKEQRNTWVNGPSTDNLELSNFTHTQLAKCGKCSYASEDMVNRWWGGPPAGVCRPWICIWSFWMQQNCQTYYLRNFFFFFF